MNTKRPNKGIQFTNHHTRSTNQGKVASLSTGRKVAGGHHPAVKKPVMHAGDGVVGKAVAKPKIKGPISSGPTSNPAKVGGSVYSPAPAAKGLL